MVDLPLTPPGSLDKEFNAVEIHEAERGAVITALSAPGSKARNERGALAIGKFKAIGQLRWRRNDTNITDAS
jgi:hypothetical protein